MPAFTDEESSQRLSEVKRPRAHEMAQQLKGLAARPDDLNSIPTMCLVGGEDQFLQVVICLPHPCCGV